MSIDESSEKKPENEQPIVGNTVENSNQNAPKKKEGLMRTTTGLTAVFGKPVSAGSDVSARNKEVESQYKQIKQKKLAQTAISATLGDLLGGVSKSESSQDPETEK